MKMFLEEKLLELLEQVYDQAIVDAKATQLLKRFGNGHKYIEQRSAEARKRTLDKIMESV